MAHATSGVPVCSECLNAQAQQQWRVISMPTLLADPADDSFAANSSARKLRVSSKQGWKEGRVLSDAVFRYPSYRAGYWEVGMCEIMLCGATPSQCSHGCQLCLLTAGDQDGDTTHEYRNHIQLATLKVEYIGDVHSMWTCLAAVLPKLGSGSSAALTFTSRPLECDGT